jgi:hypothetical protein
MVSGGARSTSGRKLNPDAITRSRKDDQAKFKTFQDDGKVYGAKLPDFYAVFPPSGSCGTRWNAVTRGWHEAIRRSPFASEFTELDWYFLLDTAMIHHLWMLTRADKYFKEFRQRVALFGCTPADRQRLRWVVEQVQSDDDTESGDSEDEVARKRMERLIGGA